MKKYGTISKYIGVNFVFFLMLFATVVFHTEKHVDIYLLISLLAVFYAIYKCMLKPSRISKAIYNGLFLWLTLLFGMYFFYALVLPKYSHFSIKFFLLMFALSLVTLLIFIDIPYNQLLDILIKTSVYASIAITLYVLINERSAIQLGGVRIGDTVSGNVNTLAIYLGTLTVPLLYKIIFDKKYIYLLLYAIEIGLMLLTGSKKAIIIIFLSLAILVILKNRLRVLKYIPYIVIGIATLFLVFNVDYFYNIIGFRVVDFLGSLGFNIEGASYSNSTHLRILMYKIGFQAFLERPLFGGGWFYFSHYSGLGTYSHNNYIEMLVTYGIFGFLLYYGMIINLLIKLKKNIRSDNGTVLLISLILIALINDFASVSFSFNLINYFILIISYIYINSYKKTISKGKDYERNYSVNRLQ